MRKKSQTVVIASEQQVSLFQSPVALRHTWKHVTIWREIGCQASCLQMDTEKSVYTLPDGVQNLRRRELKRICVASVCREMLHRYAQIKRLSFHQQCCSKSVFLAWPAFAVANSLCVAVAIAKNPTNNAIEQNRTALLINKLHPQSAVHAHM